MAMLSRQKETSCPALFWKLSWSMSLEATGHWKEEMGILRGRQEGMISQQECRVTMVLHRWPCMAKASCTASPGGARHVQKGCCIGRRGRVQNRRHCVVDGQWTHVEHAGRDNTGSANSKGLIHVWDRAVSEGQEGTGGMSGAYLKCA